MTDHDDAVAALKRLGLSSYEAQVFVALQRMGRGSARDVDRVTEVPRSQVYGAAESLEERGLLDLQRSDPIQYRAVGLDEARNRLRARLDDAEECAFSYLETARHELGGDDESREDIWTIEGSDPITDRAISLATEADERVVFGTDDDSLLAPALVAALSDAAARDVAVVVVSANPAVRERFAGTPRVATRTVTPAEGTGPSDKSGRLLVVDDDTVLMSVLGERSGGETAIWSAETGFASVFVGLFEGWFETFLDDRGPTDGS